MAYDTSYYDNAISQYDAYAEEQAKKKRQAIQQENLQKNTKNLGNTCVKKYKK